MKEMSSLENVVGGKLKLKGKPLNVKAGGIKKKKKHHRERKSDLRSNELLREGEILKISNELTNEKIETEGNENEMRPPSLDDILTPAERRYLEQREKIEMRRLAKTANKSHRDRIQEFNQYLANMSEHYDIPKVGPG